MASTGSQIRSATAVININRDVYIGPVNEKNVQQLRMLNDAILPVRYQDKFYADVLTNPPELSKLIYFGDVVVGSVCAKVEASDEGRKLYILTLGVLAPYRGRGLGKNLLEYILGEAAKIEGLNSVYLHVQTSNDHALEFYKHFGFEVTESIDDYYKRITPSSAHVLTLDLSGKTEPTAEDVPQR